MECFFMTKEEFKTYSYDMAIGEGWPIGLHDTDAYFAADNTGFFCGKVNGEIVSIISCVKYGLTFAFIGSFICKKEERGKGYGYQLAKHAMGTVKDRNIGNHTVLAQVPYCQKFGFEVHHHIIEHTGEAKHVETGMENQTGSVVDGVNIVSGEFVEDVVKYDKSFFPDDRESFIRSFLLQVETVTLAFVRDGKIEGYGCVRPTVKDWALSPLIAENKEVALQLFKSLQNYIPIGNAFFVQVPEVNVDSVEMVKEAGMCIGFKLALMYTEGLPQRPDWNKVFGITTHALG